MFRKSHLALAVFCAGAALVACSTGTTNNTTTTNITNNTTTTGSTTTPLSASDQLATTTPIKHVVVIFQENVSFDHYFGTYPNATNPAGEPPFTAVSGTPTVNGLTNTLLTSNPNAANSGNGTGATNPFRLDLTQASTADQNHAYPAEQGAFNNLVMDLFPKFTGTASAGGSGAFYTTGQVMGYYDGNTVTAMWNYAQHYSMSDNSFSTTFGPSTPGAINLISGQTNGAQIPATSSLGGDGTYDEYTDGNGNTAATLVPDGHGGLTLTDDDDPTGDSCSSSVTLSMKGKNIGDLLTAANVSWGFFSGGFDLTQTNENGTKGCNRTHWSDVTHQAKKDYIPHHQPFQYYASTANPNHTRPSSATAIGTNNDGGANHQYDLNDFYSAVAAGNLPAVSYLKAQGYQDGHAGYSDPLDEQQFVTKVINTLQQSPEWKYTAVIIAYDDSDGWYDHVNSIVNGSNISVAGFDRLGNCTSNSTPVLNGINGLPVNGRCGFGPRQPLLVISPYSKQNYVDHTLTDQTSILRFIEDNWLSGQRIGQGSFDANAGVLNNMFNFGAAPNLQQYLLDGTTGEPVIAGN